MPLIREKDGKRLHVKSKLMGESLVSKSFMDDSILMPKPMSGSITKEVMRFLALNMVS